MKSGRLWIIFTMALLMGIGAAHNAAYALDNTDWEGVWFKGKLSGKGYCNGTSDQMEKDKLKETIYIWIKAAEVSQMDAYLVFYDDDPPNSEWHSISLNLEKEMGDYDRGVFSTQFTITEDAEISGFFLGFLLTGKENRKTGELKRGTLNTICGAEIGFCTMSIGFKSKTIKESKVPQAVKDAITD